LEVTFFWSIVIVNFECTF